MEGEETGFRRSKEQVANLAIIAKCMKYVQRYSERQNVVRDSQIDNCVEDYLSERRKYFFQLLDEIQTYPAPMLKTVLNYKINYDDE